MEPRKAPESKDGDSLTTEVESLRRERARLRIAYITLYTQYIELDEQCHKNGHKHGTDR